MKNVQSPDKDNILIYSVHSASPIVLTTKTEKGWNLYKSQFKSSQPMQNIVCEPPQLRFGSAEMPGGKVAVSFRLGHKKILFRSSCLGDTLTWPSKMTMLQRTAYERVAPSQYITVRFWKHDDGENRTVYYAQLVDLSAGGMQVSMTKPCEQACYTCSIDAEKPVRVDAILRKSEPQNERLIVSFQFVGLEFSDEGQKTLRHLSRLTRRYRAQARRPG